MKPGGSAVSNGAEKLARRAADGAPGALPVADRLAVTRQALANSHEG